MISVMQEVPPGAIWNSPMRREALPAEVVQARGSLTDLSVLLCAGLLLAICLGGHRFTKEGSVGCRMRMPLLVAIWYWTTTTWATESKNILTDFTAAGSEPGFPLLGFWLTFLPQLLSSVVCVGTLCWRYGTNMSREMLALHQKGKSFWFVAGAGYWYGQFFTVQSLVFGTPALTFVVKAAEPLSTALLAVLVLRKAFSPALVAGVFVACLGIVITALAAGSSQGGSAVQTNHGQLAGVVFAVLGNLGYSSRACIAKKAISHLHVDVFETYGMMTIVGTQAGILPIIAYAVTSRLTPAGTVTWALPFLDPRFSAYSWFMMSLSYMLYQTSSVLILSSIAVESHALLVAMKHMLVVVLVSILVHSQLTKGIVFGMLVTLLGVYLYMSSAKEASDKDKEELPTQDAEVLPPLQKPVSAWQAPTVLSAIVGTVALLGAATPVAIAACGIRSASSL